MKQHQCPVINRQIWNCFVDWHWIFLWIIREQNEESIENLLCCHATVFFNILLPGLFFSVNQKIICHWRKSLKQFTNWEDYNDKFLEVYKSIFLYQYCICKQRIFRRYWTPIKKLQKNLKWRRYGLRFSTKKIIDLHILIVLYFDLGWWNMGNDFLSYWFISSCDVIYSKKLLEAIYNIFRRKVIKSNNDSILSLVDI